MAKLDSKLYQELQSHLFKKENVHPYGLQYWYFNYFDLDTKDSFTLLIVTSKTKTKLNTTWYDLNTQDHIVIYSDFKQNLVTEKKQHITVSKDKISSEYFFFELDDEQKVSFKYKNYQLEMIEPYVEHTVIDLKILNHYNISYQKDRSYFFAQNVHVHTPLVPWGWLHFMLEDGTYVKVFSLFGQQVTCFINDQKFKIAKVTDTSETRRFLLKKDEKYLDITVKKNNHSTMKYKPQFSPTWTYNQIGVELQQLETNIDAIKNVKSGIGVLEIAEGVAL